jgi:hypothetical protein
MDEDVFQRPRLKHVPSELFVPYMARKEVMLGTQVKHGEKINDCGTKDASPLHIPVSI